jgi:hypothetical protein
VEQRRALVEDASSTEQAAADLTDSASTVAPDLADAEKATAAAGERVVDLRTDADAARTTVRAAQSARDRVRLLEQLAELDRVATKVEEASTALRSADAELATLRLDDEALAGIEAAERDVVAARAALETDAAAVVVRALRELDLDAGGAVQTVTAGSEVTLPLSGAVHLRLGELAEVSVSAGATARRRAEALAAADALLARRCTDAGCDDPDEARSIVARRRAAEQARTAARSRLDAALGDLTPDLLADRRERLREQLGDEAVEAFDVTDLDAAEDAVRAAQKASDEAEAALEEAQADQRAAADALAALRTRSALLTERADAARAEQERVHARLAEARAQHPDEQLAARLRETEEAAARAELDYGEAAAALEAQDPAVAREEADHAAAVLERLADELRRDEDELRDVRARLLVRGEQGLHDAFDAARGALEHAERERTRLEAQAAAARLLYERMSANRDAARRAYAAPFREKLERLGAIVFGQDLRVDLDEDLRIVRRTLDGTTLAYEQLSSGAREQLAVLARLACAAIIGTDGGVPLILDDALGYSDPTRLERLGAAFRVGARETQVIVLTCVPDRYQHFGDATVIRL